MKRDQKRQLQKQARYERSRSVPGQPRKELPPRFLKPPVIIAPLPGPGPSDDGYGPSTLSGLLLKYACAIGMPLHLLEEPRPDVIKDADVIEPEHLPYNPEKP